MEFKDRLRGLRIQHNSQAYLGVCISAYTGLRLGEVCGLKWSDYDTDGQIISVKRQML